MKHMNNCKEKKKFRISEIVYLLSMVSKQKNLNSHKKNLT